ncbi:2'-5' RNA ligase superfamily protein [Hydrogenispora ethanolica]|uniref:2'-5' RNA ligase superfamily protein n=1 Tax=Hydrogenispora ethanolica TaxID=1082276 RepID=A0A4R1S4S9_HYDET|nr:2'-5' RNA ligase family protein [Hydrogenispora ethanolica]TCL74286.1 2'-5' RNA ligase superfamily protein [Hydrogenispora ethanolica]
MPFAIELFFDSEFERLVRGVWEQYARAGITAYLYESDARPHITLAVFDDLRLEECQSYLDRFVKQTRFFPLEFSHLGVFHSEKNVVFLGPTVTPELLAMHRNFHELFTPFIEHEWESYHGGRWVPHCTLGMDIPRAKIPEAVALAMAIPLPLECRIAEVGLIEFRPVRNLCRYKLE